MAGVLLVTAVLATFCTSRNASADAPKAAQPSAEAAAHVDAEQVVHLLDYVAADYGKALGDGKASNESELAEQVEILAEAGRHAKTLHPKQGSPQPSQAIADIKRLVEARRPATEVEAAAKALRESITAWFDLVAAPAQIPSRDAGRALFEQHCAGCHGTTGRADTARAAEYTPRPANFHDANVSTRLSPLRVFGTIRFGVPNTAMVPFDFFSDVEKWNIAFYVSSLPHDVPAHAPHEARIFSLADLATETDGELLAALSDAGFAPATAQVALSDLRQGAPYDAETLHPQGPARLVLRARAELRRVATFLVRGEREAAKTALLRTYLDEVEPFETPLRSADPTLALSIEHRFKQLRRDIDDGVAPADLGHGFDALSTEMVRAARLLEDESAAPSFVTTMLSSMGIALREGVEAALLIAALLAIVGRAGVPERKRWVHAGWMAAVVAGASTWFASQRFLAMSGLGREMIEGISALLASSVLFYVSYWLFAKREAARWVSYLRAKASSGATYSLFGISFLAVYREAFETVIFYQAIISQPGSGSAAGAGALLGVAGLVGIVVAYGRAGRFAPPQSFFVFSSMLLYALAVVFAGQGISSLQTTGHLPFHPVKLPHVPALGVYSTMETYIAQATLIALAIGAAILLRSQRTPPAPPGGNGMAGSREGAKL